MATSTGLCLCVHPQDRAVPSSSLPAPPPAPHAKSKLKCLMALEPLPPTGPAATEAPPLTKLHAGVGGV